MDIQDALEKTNRMNLLYDFYAPLLTEKQQNFAEYYFRENYSLAEIAEWFAISRQAVYEHIRRAEAALEDYESRLQLLAKHERRTACVKQLGELADQLSGDSRKAFNQLIEQLNHI